MCFSQYKSNQYFGEFSKKPLQTNISIGLLIYLLIDLVRQPDNL